MKLIHVVWALVLLAVCSLARAGTPDQIQACSALNPPGKVDATALIGCPRANIFWGPATTADLVRTQVPAQAWVPYSQLKPSSLVVRKTGGAWVQLSSITVTPTPTTGGGSPTPPYSTALSLSWQPPSTNSDLSPLTDLASYNVYSGGQLLGSVKVPTTKYTTSPLAVGTYTFTVTAVNSSGVESLPSGAVSYTVTAPKAIPGAPSALKATVN